MSTSQQNESEPGSVRITIQDPPTVEAEIVFQEGGEEKSENDSEETYEEQQRRLLQEEIQTWENNTIQEWDKYPSIYKDFGVFGNYIQDRPNTYIYRKYHRWNTHEKRVLRSILGLDSWYMLHNKPIAAFLRECMDHEEDITTQGWKYHRRHTVRGVQFLVVEYVRKHLLKKNGCLCKRDVDWEVHWACLAFQESGNKILRALNDPEPDSM